MTVPPSRCALNAHRLSWQYSLRSLLAVTTCACVVLTVGKYVGMAAIGVAVASLLVLFAWALAAARAPEATKYLSVGLILAALGFSLLTGGLIGRREKARRTLPAQGLRSVGAVRGVLDDGTRDRQNPAAAAPRWPYRAEPAPNAGLAESLPLFWAKPRSLGRPVSRGGAVSFPYVRSPELTPSADQNDDGDCQNGGMRETGHTGR